MAEYFSQFITQAEKLSTSEDKSLPAIPSHKIVKVSASNINNNRTRHSFFEVKTIKPEKNAISIR